MSAGAGVIDRDEYGQPVGDAYRRLGAGATREDEAGLYVRFEPGFGLNVHVGIRKAKYPPRNGMSPPKPDRYEDDDGLVLAIGGWERLVELVDEWRARNG